MKKILKMGAFLLCLALPKAHAQIVAMLDPIVQSMLAQSGIDAAIYYAQSIANQVEEIQNTIAQVQIMRDAAERSWNNLKSITDVKSFDDFMKWQNRQLYLERQTEARFKNLGIKIGDETYTMTELDKIPEAVRKNYGREYWENFSEEERASMYRELGLDPANYMYVKTWGAREEYYMQKFLTDPERIVDESAAAEEDNKNIIQKYLESREDVDTNQILKNTHITQMKIEMVLRELSDAIAEKNRFEYEKRKLAETPPNAPRLSDHWDEELFSPLTDDDWTTTIVD